MKIKKIDFNNNEDYDASAAPVGNLPSLLFAAGRNGKSSIALLQALDAQASMKKELEEQREHLLALEKNKKDYLKEQHQKDYHSYQKNLEEF